MSNVKVSYSDFDYDEHITKNAHCIRENKAIESILNKYIKDYDMVLDIGAGTGLVREVLLKESKVFGYVGVDLDKKFCEQYGWIECDGFKFMRKLAGYYDVVTALFSYDYINPLVMFYTLKHFRDYAVIMIQDRPYLPGSDSIYSGRKWFFLKIHFIRKHIRNLFIWILKKMGKVYADYNLLDEPYYRVLVLKK